MGRWTAEEKQRFIDALKVYGKDWKKVEKFIGTRSGA
jgi:SHAQKYF class myb-like DNA-binding protein